MSFLARSILAWLLLVGASAPAGAFETPSTLAADAVPGRPPLAGPNYTIEPDVASDGLMRMYVLRTRFGTFDVTGDELLRVRLRELEAIRTLQAMSESDTFTKALSEAGAAPLRFGADLITDPGATLKKSASGVANMFDRIGAGVSNQGASRENMLKSLAGIEGAKRALAVRLGVDPYTDFPPLASKLNDVATASGLGGLSMKALLMVIPGGAGAAISSASTADSISGMLAQKTSAQIAEMVHADLQALQVPRGISTRLVQNRAYTPADLLIMSRALRALQATNTSLFVARAAAAPTREEALFQRRRAQLLAEHANALGVGGFVDVAGFPLNSRKGGGLVALFPTDEIAWTESVARAFSTATSAAADGPRVLATPGTLTPLAEKEIVALGWSVERLQ